MARDGKRAINQLLSAGAAKRSRDRMLEMTGGLSGLDVARLLLK